MGGVRRPGGSPVATAALIGVAVVAVLLWLVRPLWHGLALFLWTAPDVWLVPVLVLVAGAVIVRRQRSWRTVEDLVNPRRVPPWVGAFPAVALVVFILLGTLHGPLVSRAIVKNTTYAEIPQLPAGGQVRLVPREVAEQNASSAFNSPTETLTDFRIVRTSQGLRWTALRTPQGAVRTFSEKSKGLVELDAQETARSLRQIDAEFEVAPGLQITDNLRWKLLKRRFLVDLQDPVGIETPRGPRIMVPYLEHKGLLVRRPVLGGVFVVAPDGSIEDLEPEEAARRPELAGTGRVYPDTLARRVQDAYAYKNGLWNAWFLHEEQTQITDTELNRQPYLIDFGGELGPQWVTVAEPYGRAFAANAVFLTDARTGRTRIWKVPRGRSLSGNRRALQAVRAVSIPGVDFGDARGTGNFRVVEPRPVFVAGRLVYLASVIPVSANAVSKTVVVDAETNKLVAVFDNDRDPQAEEKTREYLRTGRVPGAASPATDAGGEEEPAGAGEDEPPGTTTPSAPPSDREVQRRIDELVERQRELLEETQALQEALREERRSP